jgi:hypothetical protein
MPSIVKGLTGKEVCLLKNLDADDTVAEVKAKIEAVTELPARRMKLGISSKVTRDDRPICTYDWKPGDTIVLVVVSNSGMSTPEAESPVSSSQENMQETSEYGYVQIDEYAFKHRQSKRGITPGPKRWVPLPPNVQVHGHACSRSACSTPRSTFSESSLSTVATVEDLLVAERHVHFCDGARAGSDAAAEVGMGEPLAEWIYVDRDICGFSLYEYDPLHNKEFASSPFAREFLEELCNVESVNDYNQRKMAACERRSEEHTREEDKIDQALMAAGVCTVLLQ